MLGPLDALTEINLDDLVNAFGWQDHPLAERLARRLFFKPAQKFAQQMLDSTRPSVLPEWLKRPAWPNVFTPGRCR